MNETLPRRTTMRGDNWRKAKTSEAQNLILQQKDVILYIVTTLCKKSFRGEDLEKALHLHSLKVKASTCCHVSRQSVSMWQVLQANLKNTGSTRESQVLTWEERSMDSGCCSVQRASRNRELCVVQKILEICLSENACLGKPRSTNNRSFIPSNVDSRWKSDNAKGMKGGHKEGAQKQKLRKVHFFSLMYIHRVQMSEYTPENVRESNLKCGNYEIENWDNHYRIGWRLSSMKTCENEFKITSSTRTIIEYFGMSHMTTYKSWIMDYGSLLREKEENFDNLCCESSMPTVEYLQYGSQDSNNVKTKMNLQACIGKPLLSRCR